MCAQRLGTPIRYAGDGAEDGPHTFGVSATGTVRTHLERN